MSTPDEPNEFERRTKALFDHSVDELDASTRTKLARARAAALKETDVNVVRARWRVFAPAAGLAAAAIGAVAIAVRGRAPTRDTAAPLEDLDLLAAHDPEMLEDLEFYAWLDEQPEWRG